MKIGDTARLINVAPNKCWRKQRWKSEGAAKAQLRSILKSAQVVDGHQLTAYLCRHCQFWHVGHLR